MPVLRKFISLSAAALILPLAASAAFADADCPAAAKDTWMTKEKMTEKAKELGYERFNEVLVSGNCYEIYGFNKAGKMVEVYFNPVDGAVVKEEVEDEGHEKHGDHDKHDKKD